MSFLCPLFKDTDFISTYEYFVHMFGVCVPHNCLMPTGSDYLELELKVVASCQVGAGNRTQVSTRVASTLDPGVISPVLSHFIY